MENIKNSCNFLLWPFRPRPKAEEGFSSWFSRVAWENALSPAELYRIALPGARMYRVDLERFACDALIQNLATHTGVPEAVLWDRTHRRWVGRLYEEDEGNNKLLWLPPAGTYQTSRSFGQQVCSKCLKEQKVAYLKITWRLAFVTTCERHGVYLIDRCPGCGEPIQPLYASPNAVSVSRCWKCDLDLSRVDAVHINDGEALRTQERLIEIADKGWVNLGAYGPVYSLAYFWVLWRVYRLLATGRFAYPLRKWIGGSIPVSSIPRIKEIELLNPRCRQVLLQMACDLMEDWPDKFINACRELGLSSRVLMKDKTLAPFAYWDPVTRHLNDPSIEISKQEIENAKAHLKAQGIKPTYKALKDLLGAKFQAYRQLAEPSNHHQPCGTNRYWKLDGVSPEVRAAAKRAAHREGENIGAWVNHVLQNRIKNI